MQIFGQARAGQLLCASISKLIHIGKVVLTPLLKKYFTIKSIVVSIQIGELVCVENIVCQMRGKKKRNYVKRIVLVA